MKVLELSCQSHILDQFPPYFTIQGIVTCQTRYEPIIPQSACTKGMRNDTLYHHTLVVSV
jgi:hypothetical protein